jgi:hypothetical protein
VDRALSLAGVSEDGLEIVGAGGLRELHARGALPVRLSLGAVVVLDAAYRTEQDSHTDDKVLDHAVSAANRFIDLIPDRAFDRAVQIAR